MKIYYTIYFLLFILMTTLNTINYKLPKHDYKLAKHADTNIIQSNLSIKKMDEILSLILVNYCKASVLGFNNTFGYYWCKIEENKKCVLYSEIRLVQNLNNSSLIIIINDNNSTHYQYAKKNKIFIDSIKEGLYSYEKSNCSND